MTQLRMATHSPREIAQAIPVRNRDSLRRFIETEVDFQGAPVRFFDDGGPGCAIRLSIDGEYFYPDDLRALRKVLKLLEKRVRERAASI
ncbi:hypothetical protein RSP795_10355 [Ralstonia solanacearum]|uniref:hypothetical protein n=1 Tax=Ralstonia solanacearum TaxID=305 RepID=UPI0007D80378|nr:hypothetical protein [Ralstonia solanacearum]OAI62829.1 hypothetical protein RSP795_10355 [Ralstonia solanacearum]